MSGASRHPMQRLTEIPLTGPVPERDPEYGIVYTIVDQADLHADEIREEVDFDGIRTDADGYVHLTLGRDRTGRRRRHDVARVAMTSYHADARLVVLDPIPATATKEQTR